MAGEIYLDGTVTPTSDAPIAYATDLNGGFRQVADAAARNAIPAERRTKFMIAQQQDTGGVYSLVVSPPYSGTDADWYKSRGLALYLPVQPVGVGTHTVSVPTTNVDVAVDNSDPDMTALVLELDSAADDGNQVSVKDSTAQFASRPTIISPLGGLPIQQLDGSFGSDLVLDQDGQSVIVRKDFNGWVIISSWNAAVPVSGNLAGVYVSRPASGTAVGERYSPTDGGPEYVWDGTLWRPALGTILGVEPPSSGWTALDGGNGADIAFDHGFFELSSTSVDSANKIAQAVRSFDGSGDFDVRARIRQIPSLRNSGGGLGTFASGLCLRDSGTGNFIWFLMQANSAKTKQIQVSAFTNATTFSYDLIVQDATQWFDDSTLWVRVKDVSGTRTYYISSDGLRWWQIAVQTGGSRYPVAPDQVGLAHQGYVFSGSAAWDSGVRLESLEGVT